METKELIDKAIEIIKTGGIVIFPTDTAFGIGCRIDNPQSVDRLFSIRRRPRTQATPVLVGSMQMALPYFLNPKDIVRQLMNQYWPGALTIVSTCHTNEIYSPIRGGTNKIGLRMPDNKMLLDIIASVGVPLLGPSANFHGEPTPFTYASLDPELIKLVDLVIPGMCKTRQASTVIDCSTEPITILRQGAITLNNL